MLYRVNLTFFERYFFKYKGRFFIYLQKNSKAIIIIPVKNPVSQVCVPIKKYKNTPIAAKNTISS
jgi:hypothetical protein